ncbi:MAG: TMEM175 family protein [Candidatus Binataceae bacterium]|jgi:uncharacterized membrane protein
MQADPTEFRTRGDQVLRAEALSDVVFGFALTLLVVSLQVPRTFDQLIDAMRSLPSFAVTFLLLITVWRAHYEFFRRYSLSDRVTMALNTILLFVVLFYVYPLKFLFSIALAPLTGANLVDQLHGSVVPIRPQQAPVLMEIFSIGFTAVYAVFALMFANAYRLRESLELNQFELIEARTFIVLSCALAVTGLVAIAVAMVLPGQRSSYSGWIYATIPVTWQIIWRWGQRQKRRLADNNPL